MATDYLAAAREAAADVDDISIGAVQDAHLQRVQAFATLALAEALSRIADTVGSVDLPCGAEDTDDDVPGKPLFMVRCGSAVNIAGEHFQCELSIDHDGLAHSNGAAQAIWRGSSRG